MVRLVVAYENLALFQIHVAVNFDLHISTGTNFFSDKFRSQMGREGNILYISSHFKLQ